MSMHKKEMSMHKKDECGGRKWLCVKDVSVDEGDKCHWMGWLWM